MTLMMFLFLLVLVVLVLGTLWILFSRLEKRYRRKYLDLQQEQVQAENRIAYQHSLLQQVNDAIITYDQDQIIRSWNQGAESVYGWNAAEVTGKYAGGSLRVGFHGAEKELILKALEEKGSWKGELVHRRKDGTTAHILTSTSRIKDVAGKDTGLISINKDITELMESDKVRKTVYRISELANTAMSMDDLFTGIHVLIEELMDARNMYIALADPAKEVLTFPYFVDTSDERPLPRSFLHGLTEKVIRTGTPVLLNQPEIRGMADRQEIEILSAPAVSWLGVPLIMERRILGALVLKSYTPEVIYSDEEKQMLIYVSEQIALSIHRLTVQQELVEARDKAETSNRLTKSLLANMNHELRTPMNGILGFAGLMVADLDDPQQRKRAENILVSGRRLMNTLDSIMDLSYLESTQEIQYRIPVSVRQTVEAVCDKYESLASGKNLKMERTADPDQYILGHEHLFRHLIGHLLDNAIKFTEKGSIEVRAARILHKDRPSVRISIRDTGIGIAEEDFGLIFDAFRQVSEGYGRRFEGTGLGLSIARRIVELFQGEIGVSSTPGEGSEFFVILPSAEGDWPVVKQERKVRKPAPPQVQAPAHAEILLVEDNAANIQLTLLYLEKDYPISFTTSGSSAIDLCRERQYRCILMDINLGSGIDGIETMKEIRKLKGFDKVPIIAVTGYAALGDRERFLGEGFDEYLPKPFNREEMHRVLRKVLGAD